MPCERLAMDNSVAGQGTGGLALDRAASVESQRSDPLPQVTVSAAKQPFPHYLAGRKDSPHLAVSGHWKPCDTTQKREAND